MQLYHADLSANSMRVRAVAHELDMDLQMIPVDLRKGEHKSASFLELNPNGKVPVLVDDDFVLWESRAINAYLASRKPERGLYPDDSRRRALADQWSYWQAVHLGPPMQRIAFERVLKPRFGMGEPDETAIEGEVKEAAQLLRVLDAGLADRQWIAGELSIADFALSSNFTFRRPAGISLVSYPNAAAWIERVEARPSWQAAARPMLELV